ncbi:unnamed protein product [Clonostachys rosea f. rosea IK726]|uniref:NADPH-dependent FMN reductase-like domain-containing protein n=2 Tax=Bionectria ochroleuca TaxID=29856 RepID=A0A0B7JSY6_BIOOC|nr:unnamed protein product [Clonostachys rosea f. rosea IK726]
MYRIAVVTCSTRSPRLNPFVTQSVYDLLESHHKDASLALLDLAEQSLPLYNEPAVPSQLPRDDPTPHYTHEHTQKWSATAKQFDAFIFVTPQYNWSVPASLKNALDYLYHEWSGKPAAIVTYGVRGGGRAGGHLRQILMGLRMNVATTAPELFIDKRSMERSMPLGKISPEDAERWEAAGLGVELGKVLQEVLELLKEGKKPEY